MSATETDSSGDTRYPQREDRVNEEPSAKNAQSLFPPDACIFVGNLCTKIETEKLAEDVKKHFSKFGTCHVKIKLDKKKRLPGAFVQFEKVEDAQAALEQKEQYLHGRLLRLEKAKGERTALLGLRNNLGITREQAEEALKKRGALQSCTFQQWPVDYHTSTQVCKVTFAYVGDCHDAIKHFEKDEEYYLQRLDMEDNSNNNQTWSQGNNGRPYRNRVFPPSPPSGNNHPNRQNSNWRPPRGSPARGGFTPRGVFTGRNSYSSHHRGTARGFQRNLSYNQHHRSFSGDNGSQQMYPEGFMSSSTSSSFHENYPPFGHPPQMQVMPFNGPPGYVPGMQAQPPAHGYGQNYQGPLIVSSQPQYNSPSGQMPQVGGMSHGGPMHGVPMPQYFPDTYGQEHGYGSSSGGYYPQSFHPYNQSYFDNGYSQLPSRPEFSRQANRTRGSSSPPAVECGTNEPEEQEEEVAGIEHLLDRTEPEKAPKLIRVRDSSDEHDPKLENSSLTEGEHDVEEEEGSTTPKRAISEVMAKTSSLEVTKKDVEAAHTDAENETEISSPRASVTDSSESDAAKQRRLIGYKSPTGGEEDQEGKKSPAWSEDSSQVGEVDAAKEPQLELQPQPQPQSQPQPESSQAMADETKPIAEAKSDSDKETVKPTRRAPPGWWIPTHLTLDKFIGEATEMAAKLGFDDEDYIQNLAEELFREQESYKRYKAYLAEKRAAEEANTMKPEEPGVGSTAGESLQDSQAQSGPKSI